MAVAVPPTEYLKANLDPISKGIDAQGAPNILMGLIASGGEPHIYITGNMKGSLQAECYEAIADLLRSRASELRGGGKGIVGANDIRF